MRIREVMSSPVVTIEPTATIAAAARRMRDADVGCLLVGSDDRVLGIVTDRDIVVRGLAEGKASSRNKVWTVMSTEVLCCLEDEPIEAAARLMAEHGVRRLPVLDGAGRPTGVVSLSDLRGGASREAPWRVTFYKTLADVRGRLHEAPLTTVHVGAADSEGAAEAAARTVFDSDWSPERWKGAADGVRVDGRAKRRRTPPRGVPNQVVPLARATLGNGFDPQCGAAAE